MARTLKDDIAADLYNVILNTDEFAETVSFTPGGGGPMRRIVANITHSQRGEANEYVNHEIDEITVAVGNDESHTKGGVAEPLCSGTNIDSLVRDGDTEAQAYVFTGRGKELIGGWELEFERPKTTAFGAQHRAER